jgi:hypothetical protein
MLRRTGADCYGTKNLGRGASRAGNTSLKLTDEPREVYGCSVDIMGCGDQYSRPRINMDYLVVHNVASRDLR